MSLVGIDSMHVRIVRTDKESFLIAMNKSWMSCVRMLYFGMYLDVGETFVKNSAKPFVARSPCRVPSVLVLERRVGGVYITSFAV